VGASERDEFLRTAWRALVAGEIDAERLVFVDEMGANISLAPVYAWSRRGERAFASVPRNWGKNITLLASMSLEGMGECLAVEGSTTTAVFEAYLEGVLVPSLRPGQVVVMDNLSAHKGSRVRELIAGKGCELIYLPPYSPDFKWDEKAEIMLRAEPTMTSVEDRRVKADPQEGGLWSCLSTTTLPPASTSATATATFVCWTPRVVR
jgi:hypothetical protein